MSLTTIHGYLIGFAVIGSWLIIGFWSLALRFAKYEETPTFWRAVSVAQMLLGVQWLVGLILLVMGRLPGPPGRDGLGALLFHLSYSVFSPIVILFLAHRWARDGRWSPHTIFALTGLIMFGLLFRAYQVGIEGF
ncbi:MAG: hypothetical protein ACRDYA_25035 [Egibacteraceae bacterium]